MGPEPQRTALFIQFGPRGLHDLAEAATGLEERFPEGRLRDSHRAFLRFVPRALRAVVDGPLRPSSSSALLVHLASRPEEVAALIFGERTSLELLERSSLREPLHADGVLLEPPELDGPVQHRHDRGHLAVHRRVRWPLLRLQPLRSERHQRVGSDVSDPSRTDALEHSLEGCVLPSHVTLATTRGEVRQVRILKLGDSSLRPAFDRHPLFCEVTLPDYLGKPPRRNASVCTQDLSVRLPV